VMRQRQTDRPAIDTTQPRQRLMCQALDRGEQDRVISPPLVPGRDVEGPTPPKIEETAFCLMHTLAQLPRVAPRAGERYS
jgi:hypothetical protein